MVTDLSSPPNLAGVFRQAAHERAVIDFKGLRQLARSMNLMVSGVLRAYQLSHDRTR